MQGKRNSFQKNVLGRGLNAILNNDIPLEKNEEPCYGSQLKMVPINCIVMNPFQPRKDFNAIALQELSDSIKEHGIIQPVTVKKLENGQFQLVTGERRVRAAQLADLEYIPVYIRTVDDRQMLELALIENIQREALNPIEIALSYQRLLTECQMKQEELGLRVGKDRTTITNYLRLLKLPPDMQVALRDQKISMGHARALINVVSAEMQLTILQKVMDEDLSVRDVEILVRRLLKSNVVMQPIRKVQKNLVLNEKIKFICSQLSTKFHTEVSIKVDTYKKGIVKICFSSPEDLERIISIMTTRK